jgi:hypothetical protein
MSDAVGNGFNQGERDRGGQDGIHRAATVGHHLQAGLC